MFSIFSDDIATSGNRQSTPTVTRIALTALHLISHLLQGHLVQNNFGVPLIPSFIKQFAVNENYSSGMWWEADKYNFI